MVLIIQNILGARMPGTRRRVVGLGWICFTILYHLIDEFISEVNAHQDGSTYHRSLGIDSSDYPPTTTLAEEANDPSADARSERANATADALLVQYDTVMLMAVQRYKAEDGKTKPVACGIAQSERALANACCLLSEQTGFGSDDVTGNVLLKKTRLFMKKWRSEVCRKSSPVFFIAHNHVKYSDEEEEDYTDYDDDYN